MIKVCRVVTQYGKNKKNINGDWVLKKDLERYKKEEIAKYHSRGWNKEINFYLCEMPNGTPFHEIDENNIAWYWTINRYNH